VDPLHIDMDQDPDRRIRTTELLIRIRIMLFSLLAVKMSTTKFV
jgi:hypothetical protein